MAANPFHARKGLQHLVIVPTILACALALSCAPDGSLLGDGPVGQEGASRVAVADGTGAAGVIAGGGRYPLSGAPSAWGAWQSLLAGDGKAYDAFGSGLAVSGERALVGAPDDSHGSAYMFVRSAGGWAPEATLLATDLGGYDKFGASLSLSGERALVGAPQDNDLGLRSGSAYVFVRSASGWAQEIELQPIGLQAVDYLGQSVSLSGDRALLGAPGDDDLDPSSGAAYVFVRSATSWLEEGKLLAGDGALGDELGKSVSLDGDVALVGAPFSDGLDRNSGSAYVFVRSASSWSEQAKLQVADGAAGDTFGQSVSLSGNLALVGARHGGVSGGATGAAYVFVRSASSWSQEAKLQPVDGEANDWVAWSVSLSGERALVGAHLHGASGASSGAAYVFVRSASSWSEEVKLLAVDGVAGDEFGKSVALSGGLALVGAPGHDDMGTDSGSAYIWKLGLGAGERCPDHNACASGFCVDGVCCDGACDRACEACDLVALEGSCAPISRGSVPTIGCEAYVCNGVVGSCPGNCAADEDCASAYQCQSALACVPKEVAGKGCAADSVCLSGHCVDGVCCDTACDEGCGSCALAGFEGACRPLEARYVGTPSCAPYLCTGADAACPSACAEHSDCARGNHCEEGSCQPDGAQGNSCSQAEACTTGHCTDGICCLVDDCGAYRCSAAGTCEAACSSRMQCAKGYQCTSGGRCQQLPPTSAGEANESGACHLTGVALAKPRGPSSLGALAWLVCLGLMRRRRRLRGSRALRLGSLGLLCVPLLGCSPDAGLVGDREALQRATPRLQATKVAEPAGVIAGGGRYPLSRAPVTWVERQKLLAADGAAGSQLGHSASLSGDSALVGAPFDGGSGSETGSAYVFVRSASSWSEEGKLLAGDRGVGDEFGYSVSLSGDRALVGARFDDELGFWSGSAYIFVRSASSWSEEAKLLPGDGRAGYRFGTGVSLSGDRALVGADGSGFAYVFVRSASNWSEETKLQPSDGSSGIFFGLSVSLNGDQALVGAPEGNDQSGELEGEAGAAYVFVRSASGWLEEAKLLQDPGTSLYEDYFGYSVSLSGDRALVGVRWDDDAGTDSGSAYVFVRSASSWASEAKLYASDGAQGDQFGTSVSLSDDRALVGSPGNDQLSSSTGSAYVFVRSASSWSEDVKLLASDRAPGDLFGQSVSLSGAHALVGALGNDDPGSAAGSAYIFGSRLVAGQSCIGADDCANRLCVDGVCCDSACDGACEVCNLVALEGICSPIARGSAPKFGCDAYVCNGSVGGCPDNCAADEDCASAHHCQSALACVPKEANGKRCADDSVCLSGHCIDGVCCETACDEGCGSCVVAGFEGACRPLEAGHSGLPNCAPYLCSGGEARCPSACSEHTDCADGSHCEEGSCQGDRAQGESCTDGNACGTGHCTDGVCCLTDSCGAYRCGPGGACEAACSSSAQCASGRECTSAGNCEPRPPSAGDPNESGACHLASVSASKVHGPWGGLGALGCLLALGAVRRRSEWRPERSACRL